MQATPETALNGPRAGELPGVIAYEDEPLRVVVFRMAETGVTQLPVVAREDNAIVGTIALADLLTARTRVLDAEKRRERVFGSWLRRAS